MRGMSVSAFKCGPDYIDPMFHRKVLGLPSKNLDLYFSGKTQLKQIFLHENESDISVIEGVMGLYDGLGGTTSKNSTYELAQTLQAPVILVIDAKGMGYSILAEIKGFLSLDRKKIIKGVILNNASEMIFKDIKNLIEAHTGIKVLGYLRTLKNINIESRYLGLKLPDEISEIQKMTEEAAVELEKTVDVESLIALAAGAGEFVSGSFLNKSRNFRRKVRIAVARDEAFCFYYKENLSLLEHYGAELVEFSPVHDEKLPEDIDGIILGGGYPELFAEKLASNESMKRSVKAAFAAGIPCLAECGGFMYLHESLVTESGKSWKMAGVIDGKCSFQGKLVRFGYAEFTEKKSCFMGKKPVKIRGHEFHYYDSSNNGGDCLAVKPVSGRKWECGFVAEGRWLGFAHLYYASNTEFVKNFIKSCSSFRNKKSM